MYRYTVHISPHKHTRTHTHIKTHIKTQKHTHTMHTYIHSFIDSHTSSYTYIWYNLLMKYNHFVPCYAISAVFIGRAENCLCVYW